MLRYSNHNQSITLADRINANKYNAEELKTILNNLSDQLLDDMPALNVDEIDDACKLLLTLFKNDSRFQSIFMLTIRNPDEMKNIDDLKYHLSKTRYYEEFAYGSDEKYKNQHCEIAYALLKEFAPINLNDLIENKIDAINSLRTWLINRKPASSKEASRTNLALLILAKYWPLNEECLITLDTIDPKNRVFTTSGHQFDLIALFENHDLRPVRYTVNGVNFETAENKKLLHPITNQAFSDFDKCHIEAAKYPAAVRIESYAEEYLYDFTVVDVWEDLHKLVKGVDSAWHEINMKRVAHIDKADRDRLVQNILKHHCKQEWMGSEIDANDFASNLSGLIKRGLSIQKFASFESDKQEALAFSNPPAWYLIDQSVDAEKLFDLNARHLNSFFNALASDIDLLKRILEKTPTTITAVNLFINELISEQSDSPVNRL